MFETAELGRTLDKNTYAERVPGLRTQLLAAQRELRDADFSTLILLGGMDGAGKSETTNLLHSWMDARFLSAHAFGPMASEERERPAPWRHWMSLPPVGRTAIYVGSWYTDPISRRTFGEIDDDALDAHMRHIATFEEMLAAEGTLIIKLWLHIGKAQQAKRLAKLSEDPDTRWRVTKHQRKLMRRYDRLRRAAERSLRLTSTGPSPWVVIEATQVRYRDVTVAETILDRLRGHLRERRDLNARARLGPAPPLLGGERRTHPTGTESVETVEGSPVQAVRPDGADAAEPTSDPAASHAPTEIASSSLAGPDGLPTILDTVDLERTLGPDRYPRALSRAQGRLVRLVQRARAAGISATVVLEGWDAAGKGGAIRRMIEPLDARFFRVIPIAAPTDEERAHHYLWRFWRHVPRAGHMTIYDRSWYGRVLVERVESLARPEQWRRAYMEINDFEEQLVEHGTVLVKLWLHISPAEQLQRFRERERVPWKRHKITAEDWRNRDKMPQYARAVDEMVQRTSTEYAPWTLIPAESKHYARVEAVRVVCRALERGLKQRE